MPPPGRDTSERVRALCLALPEVVERPSHGEASWFVGGKRQFAMMADRHHDDRVAVWLAAGDGVQADLLARSPDRYFRPPYVGARGWIGAYLDGIGAEPDWDELAELLADAWSVVTPAKYRGLLAQ